MANVPGILIVGDFSVQGGPAPALSGVITTLGAHELGFNRADKPMRLIPDNPSTGAPTAASLGWFPWFDGLAGQSLFVVSSSTSTTVTINTSPWTVNQFAPTATRTWFVTITSPAGVGFSDRKPIVSNTANSITVGTNWTTNPTTFHGVMVSDGRWRDYHPLAGWLANVELGSAISTRGGSSWQTLGQGVGPDAGLLREFWENVWTTAPYFQCAKYALSTPTTSAFDNTTGADRARFLEEVGRYNAAWTALANGNTLVWELLVLDLSLADAQDWVANPSHFLDYETDLTQTIAWFRSAPVLNNSNLKVVIVNHANEIYRITAPAATLLANRVHRSVAKNGTNIRVASLEGMPLHLPSPYTPSLNKPAYQQSVYLLDYPRKVRQTYELLAAGSPPEHQGSIPVYVMLGDSIAVGTISEAFLSGLLSPTLTSTPRDARQGIWARDTQQVEPYDLADNSNTSGTILPLGGADCSLMHELMLLHPVTGFVLVKRASSGSSLIANAAAYSGGGSIGGRWSKSFEDTEHWGELRADIQGALQFINVTLGRQADVRGVFVVLGTNDQATVGGGALFEAELPTFVDDLREAFSTRTSGEEKMRIVWQRPQIAASTARHDESVRVRAALAAMALADPEFVDLDVDDLERLVSDNLHQTPEAGITSGQRWADAMRPAAVDA